MRLRSRRSFVPAARNLLNNLARRGIRASEWTNHKWKTEYCENASRLRAFVPETGARPVKMGLPRAAWVKLNRLRTGVGRFHWSMHKWRLDSSPNFFTKLVGSSEVPISLHECSGSPALFIHRIASVEPLSKPQTMY